MIGLVSGGIFKDEQQANRILTKDLNIILLGFGCCAVFCSCDGKG